MTDAISGAADKTATGKAKGGVWSPAGFSWALFEFARNPYFMLVVTYVIPPYFAAYIVGDPVLGQASVSEATFWAGLIGAITAPILGAMMDRGGARKPLMLVFVLMIATSGASLWFAQGGTIDANKVFHPPTAGLGVAGTMAFLVLGFVGYTYSEMMHNAMLRSAGAPGSLSRISGAGIGLGQLSSALCLTGLVVLAVAAPKLGSVEGGYLLQRGAGPFVAVWLVVFVVPFFLFMPDGKPAGGSWRVAASESGAAILKRQPVPKWYWYLAVLVPILLLLLFTPIIRLPLSLLGLQTDTGYVVNLMGLDIPIVFGAIVFILAALLSWLLAPRIASYFIPYIRQSPEAMKYLLAALIFKDGITALLALGGVYSAGVLGWDVAEQGLYGIWASIFGAIGGLWLAGWLDRSFGPRRAIMIQLTLLCLAVILALGVTKDTIFYGLMDSGFSLYNGKLFHTLSDVVYLIIIAFVAMLAAANISASRYMMITLAPKERTSEFFGLFAMSSTATVWLGPLLTGWATRTFHDQRIGFSPVLLLLGVGLLLMLTLKKTTGAKGKLEADEPSSAALP